MITIRIGITIVSISMKAVNKILIALLLAIFVTGCAFSPGMKEPNRIIDEKFGFDTVKFIDLAKESFDFGGVEKENYKISIGDQLAVVVFGQEEYFPVQTFFGGSPYTNRIVDDNGEIFFPFVGKIEIRGKTVSEVRDVITSKLDETFNEPQVDVSITKFNSKRNIYILGEVTTPKTLSIGLVPINLSEAIAEAKGLRVDSSNPKNVYVIRSQANSKEGLVFRVNMNDASEFLAATEFNLLPGDVIFVGAANITKWNRFISQLFPFASFIGQIDNLQN